MTGQLYIDGSDVFQEFKVAILDQGYNSLISYAPLKEVTSNDWPENDGIEPDLSNPRLNTKNLTIQFGCSDNEHTESFAASLSDGAYHNFDLRNINYKARLRLVTQPDKETTRNYESFSFQFADDFPLSGYTYLAPVKGRVQPGYYLDNLLFSDYGIYILEGSDDEIMKIPAVKRNLLINNRNLSGVKYDYKSVFFQAKDVTLKCLLRAADITTFWRNYNAFLYNLIKINERQFKVDKFNDTYSCYYKNSLVSMFEKVGNEIWCEFTLTLVFTNFRPKRTWYVLGTTNNEILGTIAREAIKI